MDKNKIRELLKKHMAEEISEPERLKLWVELDNPENAIEIKEIILELSYETGKSGSYDPDDWEEMIFSISDADTAGKPGNTFKIESSDPAEVPVYRIAPKRRQLTWIEAAAILILLFGGSYFFFSRKYGSEIAGREKSIIANDIAPGSNKAVLYLANGEKIILDSAQKGQIAKFGNTSIIKTGNGKLLYASKGEKTLQEDARLNELRTPRGGIYQITLPDGTQAWLNASSSITYPTRFSGTKRNVSISGEIYFEVAKDALHPFVVSLPAKTKDRGESGSWMQVEVLGTHFNINAYGSNEDNMTNTTLFEGSVKILAHGKSRMIEPGEQASASFAGAQIGVSDKVDMEKVIAWKNGEIALANSSVEQIMQEISRWYDVDIKYGDSIPNKGFYGSIDRNVPLSSVLKALEAYGVETKLEGRTLIVE